METSTRTGGVKVKVLHLAYTDTAGVPSRWAKAHRDAGHSTRLVLEVEHEYGYAANPIVERWSPGVSDPEEGIARLRRHMNWADVVMAYDHPLYLAVALAAGKVVLYRALGTHARDHEKELLGLLAEPGVARASTGSVDLVELLEIEHAGAPYPLLAQAKPSTDPFLVHAPSNRDLKQTDALLAACDKTGWNVRVVEDVVNGRVLSVKKRSAGILDSGPGAVPDGYGVNSVEAMAMGLPAIAGASADTAERLSKVGCPVLCVQSRPRLEEALERLRDADERAELGEAGREFVSEFHSPAKRAEEDAVALGVRV